MTFPLLVFLLGGKTVPVPSVLGRPVDLVVAPLLHFTAHPASWYTVITHVNGHGSCARYSMYAYHHNILYNYNSYYIHLKDWAKHERIYLVSEMIYTCKEVQHTQLYICSTTTINSTKKWQPSLNLKSHLYTISHFSPKQPGQRIEELLPSPTFLACRSTSWSNPGRKKKTTLPTSQKNAS